MPLELPDYKGTIVFLEKLAMRGDRDSVTRLIGLFRVYRKEVAALLASTYEDSTQDGATMRAFCSALSEAIEGHLSLVRFDPMEPGHD